jgi:hypothetical protein
VVRLGRGTDHRGAASRGELHGQMPHAARGAVHQHRLTCADVERVDHGLVGRQARSSLGLADLRSLPEFSDTLPHEPFDAIVDRVARGLLLVVVGEGLADRLGGAVTAVPVVDYPVTHLVLAWPADQAHAPRAELVRMAGGLVRQGRLAPAGQGAGAPCPAPRE